MSITVSNVSKFYGRQKALDQVSFQVNSGEVVGFLGPNGAGKSTMMKILTGFLPPSEGQVQVYGYQVSENALDFRRKVGYLPENNPLYPDMYITEYLMFVADIYQLDHARQRVEEVIEMTGLGPERHKKTAALSKGYRQRVGLAQALLPDPEVLILDEPTSGLDPNQISGVRDLIHQLGQSKTILLSTHIMQEVKALCERVIIINKGRIVADEKPEKLELTGSGAHVLIEVEFDRQPAPEQLLSIHGISEVESLDNRWLIRAAVDKDVRADIFKFAVEHQLVLLEMVQKQPTLEHIFRQLTTG
ncbi:ATP-binding cassette domain-containing protein [Geofilum rubicundum]|uniref:ABC-type multidrug transport system, ATPase component n=1 Tax=Geofilum rubicundum JCM 15548 TaxID=1236989 RepID=A0A0E9LVC3_9BACT|nr:ATP-binding cassette domain-containing protein [Geofilum rubicundum]GAO29199.1 ABC-type multidrug transport system, ATPase component [Geofilum rubicundum JCM 15548]